MERLKQSKYYKFYFNCKDIEDYKHLSRFFKEVNVDNKESTVFGVYYPYYQINDKFFTENIN